MLEKREDAFRTICFTVLGDIVMTRLRELFNELFEQGMDAVLRVSYGGIVKDQPCSSGFQIMDGCQRRLKGTGNQAGTRKMKNSRRHLRSGRRSLML